MSDLVTKLEETQRGYRVVVNDTETFFLTRAMYRECPLQPDEEFDFAAYKLRLLAVQAPEALNRAVKLLAVRARSESEIRKRLTEAHFLEDAVELAIYKLRKEGFLNDAQFAQDWVKSRSRQQLGSARIMQELRAKGVDDELAQQAIDALAPEQSDEQAIALATKLLRRYSTDDEEAAMRKRITAMLRRGFSYAQASKALRAAIAALTEDET